jgi:hypothetical protein
MRANAASMLAALAAKSDEQDRHIAALEAAASGNDALPPDCDPGEAAAADWREGICSRSPGSVGRSGGADGRPFGSGRKTP